MGIWNRDKDEEETLDDDESISSILFLIKKMSEEKDKEIVALRTQLAARERAHIGFLEGLVMELIRRPIEAPKVDPAATKLSPALQRYLDKKAANGETKQTGKAP